MKLNSKLIPLLLTALLGGSSLIGCGMEEPSADSPVPLPYGFNQDEEDPGNGTQNSRPNNDNDGQPQENSGDNSTPNVNGNDSTPQPSPGIDGDACNSDADCLSGICLEDPEWPGGYCTTINCETRADCADDSNQNACLVSPQTTNFCIRLCDPTSPHACRQGYQCQPVGGAGDGWCAPSPDNLNDINDDGGLPFYVGCANAVSGTVNLSFNISPSTASYLIVPLTSDGGWLDPLHITTPSGRVINFRGDNYFQAVGAQLFGSVNPTIIPAAPQFAYQVESGLHTYTLRTQDSEVCYYLVESPSTSTTIDLNIYLLGMDGIGLTPANAASDPNMRATLDKVRSVFAQAGISIGTIRYPSVPANVEQQYRVIRSQNDIHNLARASVYHGSDANSALSANIFIVERFAFSGGGGVLGLSLGIPGAAGLHGTALSGVALTGEYMGYSLQGHGGSRINGNEFTATTFAHELGHFLGLFHTSETTGQHHDPLADTPQCTDFRYPSQCPGASNLMFPLADVGNDELTSNQGFVIRANPLAK